MPPPRAGPRPTQPGPRPARAPSRLARSTPRPPAPRRAPPPRRSRPARGPSGGADEPRPRARPQCGTGSPATSHRIEEEIGPHAERGFPFFRQVVVHVGILPAIAQIGLVAVEHDEPSVQKDPEALGRFPIMLVNLGDALGEVVKRVVDGMIQRHLDQLPVGKEPPQLPPDRDIHAVIVVGMEEAPLLEVAAKGGQLDVAEADVDRKSAGRERVEMWVGAWRRKITNS